MIFNETELNKDDIWYVGNNRSKNFHISPPEWWWPFYLTKDQSYAKAYADYGVYKITIQDNLNILDFTNDVELNQLNLPEILVEQIRKPNLDLNYTLYELCRLVSNPKIKLQTLDETRKREWYDCGKTLFDEMKSSIEFRNQIPKFRSKIEQKDEWFLFFLYFKMMKVGFDGFQRFEFNHKILAIFHLNSLDLISAEKIN